MILQCPPEKSTQFHYPLDPKKIRSEGSMHKDTTYQGSDRQDFYRHGKKKKLKKRKKGKQTNKTQTSTGFAHRQPSNKRDLPVRHMSTRQSLSIGFQNRVIQYTFPEFRTDFASVKRICLGKKYNISVKGRYFLIVWRQVADTIYKQLTVKNVNSV